MYMYYLLGYRLFGDESWSSQDALLSKINRSRTGLGTEKRRINWLATATRQVNAWNHAGKSDIFVNMELAILEQVMMYS